MLASPCGWARAPPVRVTFSIFFFFKDLGLCFGMNGHPRRDTDVIFRLSKSTIEDLSFYIGFTMELLASRILDLVLA